MENLPALATSFGELLRAYRRRKRLTQRQLAQRLGVQGNTVSSWELGTYLPATRGLVLELARYLALDEPETRHLLEASLTALTPHWSVPFPRNPYFTGREEILEALHAQLGPGQAAALTQSSALHGLGGVGKTQVALEYAYRHALDYSAICWVGAETSENIISGLLRVASDFQLPERDDKDQQRVISAVLQWLSTHSRWLFIWDNLEDLTLVDRFLPSTRSGVILLTTRCQALGTLAWGIDLLPMEREEGMLFLLRRAKVLEPDAEAEHIRHLAMRMPHQYAVAAELVVDMEGLPLALDQAGAYIEETQCGLPGYLELFHARRATLLQQRGEGTGLGMHPESVSATFTLAIIATAERHPAIGDLLRTCALLQPDAIPEEIFRQGAEHLGAQLQATCCDELSWNRLLAVASSYSLLRRQPEEQMLSLHRLVQAVLLDSMTEAERKTWTGRAVEALSAVFPKVTRGTWKQGERLLPHAMLCLHRVGTAEESLALASLAYKTADYLRERAQYPQAESLFQRALDIWERIMGPDYPDMTPALNGLAILNNSWGKYAEAELLFRRALRIRELARGPEHPEVATSLNNLAILLMNQYKYAEAELLFRRALRIREHSYGPEHQEVAASLDNLTVLLINQGKYAEAEPLCQRTLLIWEQALGSEHPEVAVSLNNLAELYWHQGKYAEAEPLAWHVVQSFEKALGPEHPDVAEPLYVLANLFREQEWYSRAEQVCQQALRIWEPALGPVHPKIAAVLYILAECYRMQGRYAEAEPLYQRALRIWEQALGPEHPGVTDPLNGLANLSRDQGHFLEAERLYRRARAIREQRQGQYHPDTAQILHDLAVLRKAQDQRSEARSLLERVLQIRLLALGETHPKTLATQALYDQFLQEQADDAEPTIEQLRVFLKARGWSLHLKKRRGKPYVYATRKVGERTQSRYLAPLGNLTSCLAAAQALPNSKDR